MKLPDLRKMVLVDGVLVEESGDQNRLAFWVPDGRAKKKDRWERFSCTNAAIGCKSDWFFVAVTALPFQRQRTNLFAKLARWLGQKRDTETWYLPTGEIANPIGDRRTDLLLVWAVDKTVAAKSSDVESQWEGCQEVRAVARNLFLVVGLPASDADNVASLSPEITASSLANRLLAEARQLGDTTREAAALTDLGIVVLREHDPARAATLLEEALILTRSSGNRVQEMDVLSSLGLAYIGLGKYGPAVEAFLAEKAAAFEVGGSFAGKTAHAHLGLAYAYLNDPARAIANYETAAGLAREAGDRQGQVDLLWDLAIMHAELGLADAAVAHGQSAVELLEKMGKPQAATFAKHLEKYRDSGVNNRLSQASGDVSNDLIGDAPISPAASGPGLLRMALSVGGAMARYVGSGFKTLSNESYQRRLKTCDTCEHYTGVRCRVCGCFAQIKARLLHEQCPLEKWPV